MSNDYNALVEQEKLREGDMIRLGKDRFNHNLKKNLEKGRHSVTPAYVYLQKELLLPLAERIAEFVQTAYEGQAGRKKSVAEPLKEIDDPKKVALIVLKTAIDTIATNKTLLQSASKIGGMLELELNNIIFKKQKPLLHQKLLKDLLKRTRNIEHRKRVFSHTLSKYKVEAASWDIGKQVIIGKQLIDILIQSTGLCKIKEVNEGRNKTVNYLVLNDEVLKKIKDTEFQCSALTPYYKPMIVSPRDWKSPYNGGFINEYLAKAPLIKSHDHRYLHGLSEYDLSGFYDAVNHIQSVPFKIDKSMLNVFDTIWTNNLPLGNFPSQESLLDERGKPKVFRDPMVDHDKETLIKYKRDCSRAHKDEIARTSKVLTDRITLELAKEHQDYEKIYFTVQADTRTRVYYSSSMLNPQSDQKIKSLISFANGEKIGQRGIYWLYVHAANCWGYDKVSFDDRYKWTHENLKNLILYSSSPLEHKGWNDADKPMEFLKTCHHIKNVQEQGEEYVCDLPVSVDATCSGLQILSILMRDTNTAEKVNVVPSVVPQDIYSIVAEKVRKEVEQHASSGISAASRWLNFGITRKIVKRNIMTYVYGLKPYGARQQIFDEYKQQIEKNPNKKVLQDDGFNDCRWLAEIVWKHIETEVKLASELMKWFQDSSKLFSKNNLPVKWTTPMGFPVVQDYRYLVPYRVKTAISGSLVYTTLRKQIDKKDSRKASSAIAPNIVHSLDASIAQCVALYARNNDEPIPNLLMIHDSFATTPNRIDQLQNIIRKSVVDLFSNNYLEKLYEEWKSQLPEKDKNKLKLPPELGSFDLQQILESKYFFS